MTVDEQRLSKIEKALDDGEVHEPSWAEDAIDALIAALREARASDSHNEWACEKNQELLRTAEAERDRLAAQVERVRALADEWENKAAKNRAQISVYVPPEDTRDYRLYDTLMTKRIGELRAALDETNQPPATSPPKGRSSLLGPVLSVSGAHEQNDTGAISAHCCDACRLGDTGGDE